MFQNHKFQSLNLSLPVKPNISCSAVFIELEICGDPDDKLFST